MTFIDNRVGALLALATLLALEGCVAESGESVASVADDIRSGTAVANAENTGHVVIARATPTGTPIAALGSGTLLSNKWALTAAHVIASATCPPATNTSGNTVLSCSHNAKTYAVGLGNFVPLSTFSPQRRQADRVSVHPRYTPAGATEPQGVDVALIHVGGGGSLGGFVLNNSATGHSRQISAAAEQTSVGQPVCVDFFGYGRSQTNFALCSMSQDAASAGTLRTAQFRAVATADLDVFGVTSAATCQTPSAATASGDSGGPYMVGEQVIGVNSRGPGCGPGDSFAIRGSKFVKWAGLVMSSIADVNFHFDLDAVPDAAFLSLDQTTQQYIVTILSGANDASVSFPIFPFSLIGAITDIAMAAGSFNGDGFGDIVLALNGNGFVLTGGASAFTSKTLTPSAAGAKYADFFTGDFNGDGIDDIEAVRTDGEVDVFYGTGDAQVVTPAEEMVHLPTADRTDGKFFAITGPNELTYPQPAADFLLYVEDEDAQVRVEIFDGRNGTGYDRYDVSNIAPSCFRLYGRPVDDDSPLDPTKLIVEIPGDSAYASGKPVFPENDWGTLYAGPNDSRGLIPFTDPPAHQYLIVATHAGCTGTTGSLGINSFKIRTSPVDLYYPLDFSFHPRDLVNGMFATGIGGGSYPSKYDTTYSDLGVFDSFIAALGPNLKKVALTDSDADRLNHPVYPGQETVANDLDYVIVDYFNPSTIIQTVTNVSGNYWEPIGALSTEVNEILFVPASAPAGTANPYEGFTWRWRKVIPNNIIRVAYEGSRVFMSSRFPRIPRVTSVQPTADWRGGGPAPVTALLPIVLGQLNPCGTPVGSSIVVNNWSTAIQVLDGKAGKGLGAAKVVRDFRTELFTTKLNVARAVGQGEPLPSAFIYGTNTTVADALLEADEALARHCHGVSCNGAQGCPQGGPVIPPQQGANLSALAAARLLLTSINANELTYHP